MIWTKIVYLKCFYKDKQTYLKLLTYGQPDGGSLLGDKLLLLFDCVPV